MSDQTIPQIQNRDSEKDQVRKRNPEQAQTSSQGLSIESMPFVGILGTSATKRPLDKHVALLSDAHLSHRANAVQRACIVRQLQRNYGNAYVQRVVHLVRARKQNDLSTDSMTHQTADRALNSRSFTTGHDLFSRQGKYSPGSSSDRYFLGYELTHMVQQTGDDVQRKLNIGEPGDKYEQEADKVARAVVQRVQKDSLVHREAEPEDKAIQAQDGGRWPQRKVSPDSEGRIKAIGQGEQLSALETTPVSQEADRTARAVLPTERKMPGPEQATEEGVARQQLHAERRWNVSRRGHAAVPTIFGRVIHRFEGEEHEQVGNTASGTATTDLDIGGGRFLTFGEMSAMAGDWFESRAEMRGLSGSAQGRQQLQWARWRALGGRGLEPSVSQDVKDACMTRYYNLAARNVSHFSAGGTGVTAYRAHHREALWRVFRSEATGAPGGMGMASARTAEAFGSHFLTDIFSAGHVRTPRSNQQTWYQTHHPNSITQIVNHMSTVMHGFLVRTHPWLNRLGRIPSQADLAIQISSLGGPALAAMSLGDLVSIAYHNRDNPGLAVVSDLDEQGRVVPGGYRWTAVGDNLLNTPAGQITRMMATRALQASLADLAALQQAGRSARPLSLSPDDLRARFETEKNAILVHRRYPAERYIPRADPAGGNVTLSWQWGSFNSEMRGALDTVVRRQIAAELVTKSAELRRRGTTEDIYAADALDEVIRRLRANGIVELETAIGTSAGGTTAGSL